MANFDELYDVVMEANAYNKYANKLQDEYKKDVKKHILLNRLANNADDPEYKKELRKKAEDHFEKGSHAVGRYNDSVDGMSSLKDYSRHGFKNDDEPYGDRFAFKCVKKNWMKKHGDVGKSPEERYKAGRYLDQQKELKGIKESVDDLRLEIYESCRYGEISEEERDILLEMI
jgi:hypothetical protein